MNKTTKILTILGSPHNTNSNTRALVEDFVEEISNAGLNLEHQVISLGRSQVLPCKGCWNCTRGKSCPLANDDLETIKAAMIACDMIIMASPVYTNQITAQMKALFDRLFTWCHIFPLLGKYSLSACTTGNDGLKPTGEFLQKMLATYGTFSFGHIQSMGGFTPGFFPFRNKARAKNKKLAKKIADTINNKNPMPITTLNKKMFKVMHDKMNGVNLFRHLVDSEDKSDIVPPAFKIKFMKKMLNRMDISDVEIVRISKMMEFEYSWWKDRGWFKAKSFKQLLNIRIPENFNTQNRLLNTNQLKLIEGI